ncbi:MAG: amino acid permease [Planctomyces sp.]|nr:amino acid permease [Planctomyces sp.]
MANSDDSSNAPGWQPRLSLWDAASLMIGIVVGTSIFVLPSLIFSNVPSGPAGLGLWALGGVLSLLGGLVFAEMAVQFPRGGAYAYLTAAFGPLCGLVYGVAFLSIIVTANIGAMSFAAAEYAQQLLRWDLPIAVPASAAILLLAILNTRTINASRRVQNTLTAAKLLGLVGIIAAGMAASGTADGVAVESATDASAKRNLGLALVLVLYAYGGWSDAAAVAAEVRNRSRNIPLALGAGLAGITLLYVLVNAAYLRALGLEGVRASSTPAEAALTATLGAAAGKVVSTLAIVSALGAIHGMFFSGSRAIASLGADHRAFRWLGDWSPTRGIPARAVWTLAAVALLQVAAVGTASGRQALDHATREIGLGGIPWERFRGEFEILVVAGAPMFWLLMLLAGAAFFELRRTGKCPGEFVCPGAPVAPLIYCATCGYLLWSSARHAELLGLLGLLPAGWALLLGLAARRRRGSAGDAAR